MKFDSFDASDLSASDAYSLLTNLVVPRPIAWVSTRDVHGKSNVAPFSYFNALCSDPPMVSLSIVDRMNEHGESQSKDTLRNIRHGNVFCVNICEEGDLEKVDRSASPLAEDLSEFRQFDIAEGECTTIECPCVSTARARLECRLVEVRRYGREHVCNLVVGDVLTIHVASELVRRDRANRIDGAQLNLLGRAGSGNYYTKGRFIRSQPER